MIAKPIGHVVSISVMPESTSESQITPNEMTNQIDNLTFIKVGNCNLFTIEYGLFLER